MTAIELHNYLGQLLDSRTIDPHATLIVRLKGLPLLPTRVEPVAADAVELRDAKTCYIGFAAREA